MPVFSTLARCKSLLSIPTAVTTHDMLLTTLLSVSDQMILDEIDLTGTSVTTYSEKFDIDRAGTKDLQVNRTPLVSVTALTVSEALQAATTYYSTAYGQVRLTQDDGFFPVGRQVVEVCYTAGFATVPQDLHHAGTLIVASLFNSGPHVGFQRESVGSYSYAIGKAGAGNSLPTIAQRILSKYKRVFVKHPGQ